MPWRWLCGIFAFIGLVVAGLSLLLRGPSGTPLPLGTAVILGVVAAGCAAVLTLTMRWLRPPFLTLRADGIYFPGRPKEGWRVAFVDIKELRVNPPSLGRRTISMQAQGHPVSGSERWWSVSERQLPNKEAFDEIYAYILSRVAMWWCVPGEEACCAYLQFASAEQAFRTTVTVEGVVRFSHQAASDGPSDPAARAAFRPLGHLFSIGQIKPGDRIVVDASGNQNVVLAPDGQRHALVLDVPLSGEVRAYFLD
jgi:hypothetical protein